MPGFLVPAAIGALGGLFGGIGKAKAAKAQAKSDQQAAQYKVNQKQKGLNRNALNFASLLKALGRQGWFGDQFMADHGTYNPADFKYDPVPLASTPGVWSSALGGAAGGALSGLSRWFNDSHGAARDASTRITSPGQPTRGGDSFRVDNRPSVIPGEDGVDQIVGMRRF